MILSIVIAIFIFFLKTRLSDLIQTIFLSLFGCVEATCSFNFFGNFIPQSRTNDLKHFDLC